MFPHRNCHEYTWTSSDGKTHNQIDHILTEWRWHTSIIDVLSFRGAECNTDHYVVVAKVKEKLVVSKQAAQEFDVEILNNRQLSELEVRKHITLRSKTGLQLWRT
jgi:hypothetical protein